MHTGFSKTLEHFGNFVFKTCSFTKEFVRQQNHVVTTWCKTLKKFNLFVNKVEFVGEKEY